jgi:hypothetical protein
VMSKRRASSELRPGDRAPISYFELQRQGLTDFAEGAGDDIPMLPSSSPWHSDPVGQEPFITGDANVMNIEIDKLNR